MKKYEFDAKIAEGKGGGAWVEFPYDVKKELETGGRVPVRAAFDGHPYRGSLAPMGKGRHIIGILKEIRGKIGKDIGDMVHVVITRDVEERVVQIPDELRAALAKNLRAKTAFEKLSYSHRKEYAEWVAEAKKAETRLARATKTVETLLQS